MSNEKYGFTGNSMLYRGHRLHQIYVLPTASPAIDDLIPGGWIESETNLSTKGNAWVYENAKVFGRAQVVDNATIRERAVVFGHACVAEDAVVGGNAQICGGAYVRDRVLVTDYTNIRGVVTITGSPSLRGHTRIRTGHDWFTIDPIGSREDVMTVTRDHKLGLRITTGCFSGSIDEFKAAVKATHGNNRHARDYRAALQLIKTRFIEPPHGK